MYIVYLLHKLIQKCPLPCLINNLTQVIFLLISESHTPPYQVKLILNHSIFTYTGVVEVLTYGMYIPQ